MTQNRRRFGHPHRFVGTALRVLTEELVLVPRSLCTANCISVVLTLLCHFPIRWLVLTSSRRQPYVGRTCSPAQLAYQQALLAQGTNNDQSCLLGWARASKYPKVCTEGKQSDCRAVWVRIGNPCKQQLQRLNLGSRSLSWVQTSVFSWLLAHLVFSQGWQWVVVIKVASWRIWILPQERGWGMKLRLMVIQFYPQCSRRKTSLFITATPKIGKEDFASTGGKWKLSIGWWTFFFSRPIIFFQMHHYSP